MFSSQMSGNRKWSDGLRERLDDFCRLCSLHGLIYLRADVQLPLPDRLFWLVVFLFSLAVSCAAIHSVWARWVHNPFVIVYDTAVKPVWDIPFPSVTLCSFVAVKRSVLDLATTTDTKGLYFSSLVCASTDFFQKKNLSVTPEEMDTFYDFMDKASPSCEEMMHKCFWQDTEFPCCKIFFPIITNVGRCFIINSLSSEMLFTNHTDSRFLFEDSYPPDTQFWSPEGGYPSRRSAENRTYPKWATATGQDSGLSVELMEDMAEWQPECASGYSGFKVLVNSPEEAPISAHAALRAPMGRDFLVQLSPRTLRTPLSLASTAPNLRGCLFQGEKRLDYFGVYSQNNCLLECVLESALRQCRCVPFFMPRNTSVPVCSKNSDKRCLRRVEAQMVASSMSEHSHLGEDDISTPWCGCYPSCNVISYKYVSNHGLFIKNTISDAESKKRNAKITIFYSDLHFLGVHRQAESTFFDFLGTCGGLLGLFMGFSCISAVEVFYHLLLRPLSCLALRKKKTPLILDLPTTVKPPTSRPPLRHSKDFFSSYY